MNPTLWLVASFIGAAVLLGLAIIYRRAASRRSLELADELLDAELRTAAERLDRPPP